MKRIMFNIGLINVFIVCLILGNYILLMIGKTNYYNYKSNNIDVNILKMENKSLKKEINNTLSINKLDKYIDYDYLKTSILIRDIYNFHENITIRYGKDKELKKGMAVVDENGLVGIIAKVNKHSSVVKLITANNSNVSIMIDENYGVLNNYDNSKKYLIANKFNNYELIMKNDEVYTSGLGLIPEGIFIGKVEISKDTNNNLEQNVYIKSNTDFNNLKYLAIIRGIKEL